MHKVTYSNSYSSWDEALPLGNGHFGAMLFFNENEITCSINHYDVYYKKLSVYGENAGVGRKGTANAEPASFEELKKRALDAHRDSSEPGHYNYNYVRNPEMKDQYGSEWNGYSHCPAGNIKIGLNTCAVSSGFNLSLEVEKARVVFESSGQSERIKTVTFVSHDKDIMFTDIEQSRADLVESIVMELPNARMRKTEAEYCILDKTTFFYIGSFHPDGADSQISGLAKDDQAAGFGKTKPFHYIVMTRLIGTEGIGAIDPGRLFIKPANSTNSIKLMTTVVTELDFCEQCHENIEEQLIHSAVNILSSAMNKFDEISSNHTSYWETFWKKSCITLEDPLIEDLWFINLYSIACCNGKGSKLYEQACGLNGLWDIKQPTIWGSSWYWDVNIEQSYWPVYTSNHTELGEPFYKALQSYIAEGEARAKEYYGMEGIAADYTYPFTFYMTIWPWCAQFFHWHFQYTQDKEFLKDQAYPLYKKILKFFESYLQFDDEKGQYYIFPDISPEQGPVTKNSAICLAFLRYLLGAAINASYILDQDADKRTDWENILKRLPFYFTEVDREFGRVIKDSEWLHPNMRQVGHTSLLAPVYPVGEISKRSDSGWREIVTNTIRYMEKSQPLSTHTSGWLACAAARIGLGDKALKILYEKVIAFMMRTNGLFAEETERWLQSCQTMCEPMYSPPLMEASGNFVAAVNEMLLQSYGGIIEVFPACPEGHADKGVEEFTYAAVLKALSKNEAQKWERARFDGLLAEGGFEVSAECRDSRTIWVKVRSLYGNTAVMVNPFKPETAQVRCGNDVCNVRQEGELIYFETEKNRIYSITATITQTIDCLYTKKDDESAKQRMNTSKTYLSPSGRRVFLGKDRDTEFIRNLDNVTFDYYAGEQRESHMARYRLDFSIDANKLAKYYEDILPKQFHGNGKLGINFKRISADMAYTDYTGLGWQSVNGLSYIDRGTPDSLRRDFIAGKCRNTFMVELPKGKYDMLFIVGDAQDPSYTKIHIEEQGSFIPDMDLRAGSFAAESLLVNQRKDGIVKITIDTIEGEMWKLCGLIINRLK